MNQKAKDDKKKSAEVIVKRIQQLRKQKTALEMQANYQLGIIDGQIAMLEETLNEPETED